MPTSELPADWRSPRLHPGLARLLLMLLERAGVPADLALAGTGFTAAQLRSTTRLAPFEVLRRLFLQLPRKERDGAGLALGALSPPTAFGPLATAMAASATLDEALAALGEFGGARARTVRVIRRRSPAGVELEIVEGFDFGDMRIAALETSAVQFAGMIAAVIGRPPRGARFAFPYSAPAWAARYGAVLSGEVSFDAPALVIAIPADELSAPCIAADPKVRLAALRECQREAAENDFERERPLVPLIRARLAEAGEDPPSLTRIAAAVAVSPRTLMRRLAQEGSTYRTLLAQSRAERACWRLAHTADTIETIAADLGYRDMSNFSRTFRRWRGLTPTAYRASLADGSPSNCGPGP